MSLGVFEYLNKPVKKKEFEQIVSFALRKSASA
jgi:YesN/AraC family two-component response regulator